MFRGERAETFAGNRPGAMTPTTRGSASPPVPRWLSRKIESVAAHAAADGDRPTPEAIARRAGVSATLVRKVLRDQAAAGRV